VQITVRKAVVRDIDFISSIFTHDAIRPYITDDYSTGYEGVDWKQILQSPAFYFVIVLFEDKPAGVFFGLPWNSVVWECHAMILPAYRGKAAVHMAKAALEKFLADRPTVRKVVTHIPEYNRGAYALAVRAGFKMVWVNEGSFLKGGKLYNQYLFEYRRR